MNQLSTKKMNQLLKKKKKGFTLVELIIVIAIIAILVALAIPKFGEIIENSDQKADMATAKNIATIVAQQAADGTAPTAAAVDATSATDPVGGKLDGNKVPKSKKADGAKTFSFKYDSNSNIIVYYTGKTTEVYPAYGETLS
ncbi:prepilin-type N-terminal cleavage/methylation domain-containing protein [Clostridium saccharobutylicum]|uniref:Fimbrial protein n=1 Tax=Clostridium saccharobutylicum TaxID=169679 RepID=A0A1S8MRJ7_CLOSA|nr:prepilin-type N-terminal cleavage/methylation domain-containing protein [Clostridium saccharobutylicum]OOM06747.1 fimbrial protein precursor [Clostridium saccharobutylicum]